MILFGPVVDDGVSSRGEREEICFSNGSIQGSFSEAGLCVSSCLSWSKRAAAVGIAISLLACPCAGLCAASADVPAIGTAVHLDLEPTLPTVRHGRRPEPVLRILRLPFDRYGARP